MGSVNFEKCWMKFNSHLQNRERKKRERKKKETDRGAPVNPLRSDYMRSTQSTRTNRLLLYRQAPI